MTKQTLFKRPSKKKTSVSSAANKLTVFQSAKDTCDSTCFDSLYIEKVWKNQVEDTSYSEKTMFATNLSSSVS